MEMVTVYRTFSPAEAQLMRSRLEAAEFHPWLKNETAALSMDGYALAVGGVMVQVPDNESESALELITAEQQ